MNFDKAVETALRTWYPESHPLHLDPHHPLGKLLGEWGELLDDYMKSLYKPDCTFEPKDELGDVWYYVRILCYQEKVEPAPLSWASYPDIHLVVNFQKHDIDTLLKTAIYDIARYSLEDKTKKTRLSSMGQLVFKQLMCCQYSVILAICKQHNFTIDDLTHSNWQKLKPGSERGEQWAKARRGFE